MFFQLSLNCCNQSLPRSLKRLACALDVSEEVEVDTLHFYAMSAIGEQHNHFVLQPPIRKAASKVPTNA